MNVKLTMSVLLASVFVVSGAMSQEAPGTNAEQAIFAGGCFWCMEAPFEKLPGVKSVVSGYIGGHKKDPKYDEVSAGVTGHVEAVQVTFDPRQVTYLDLLEVFWRSIDPTDAHGQFVDQGEQYRSAIFVLNEKQRQSAEHSKMQLQKTGRFKKPVVTTIENASVFYAAEDYHQDYYKKNPIRYKYYRSRSGRDEFIDKIWGKEREYMISKGNEKNTATKYMKPSSDEIKKKLNPMQYKVTQNEGTEPPFKNEYWDNKKPGIYVDVVTGEPLFSSHDKFDSRTGWPSFTQPLVKDHIVTKVDRGIFMTRTEVRSKYGDSHLGHVFEDGPKPTGLRYCMNSASLRFVPAEKLKEEGYEEFSRLFDSLK